MRRVLSFAAALLVAGGALASCGTDDNAAAPRSGPSCPTTAPTGLAGGPGGCAAPTADATSPAATPPLTTTTTSTAAPNTPTETEGDCPYLDAQQAEDFEGSRVGRVTVVFTDPVGCNFYFAYGDGHMTLRISTQTLADDIEAYNAMVTTGGTGAIGVHDLIPGVDAVLYRTAFYERDGDQDWACTFAKGKMLVTVNTDQTTPSLNARLVCQEIAPKF